MPTRGVGGTVSNLRPGPKRLERGRSHRYAYLFPADGELRRQWVNAAKREKWTPSKHSRLCTVHFWEEDLDRTLLRVKRSDVNLDDAKNLLQKCLNTVSQLRGEFDDVLDQARRLAAKWNIDSSMTSKQSFIINLEAGSSDDDSGSDSEHSSHREDSGGEMSGVEVLE
ncbi:uncharacterized protein LOC124373562 [Homalodisca vitripennis]|uniref:uncharacterized protein LOC124373562 n=1 Tax=Homalodisca vitripennis TaxID=197043 RepID=UPI001EEB9CBB|nr:uncharacterized protein LOC124373562 [Homalodisca vitripennis]